MHKPILLDELHVQIKIDPTISEDGRKWLLKSMPMELRGCLDIAQLGMRNALPGKDRNKFRFTITK